MDIRKAKKEVEAFLLAESQRRGERTDRVAIELWERWSVLVGARVAEVSFEFGEPGTVGSGGAAFMQVDVPHGLAVCAAVERLIIAMCAGDWPVDELEDDKWRLVQAIWPAKEEEDLAMPTDMFGNDLTKTDSFGTPRTAADGFNERAQVHRTGCLYCDMELFYQHPTTAEQRLKWHMRVVHEAKCEACEGEGWLLMDNSDHGLRIERCDSCEMFASDDEAVTYVAEALKGVKVAIKPRQ